MVEMEGPIFRDIRRYYCQFCGICRSKKALLTAHVLSHHQEEVKKQELESDQEGPTVNVCDECGAEFKKPAHLKQHMQSHSLEGLTHIVWERIIFDRIFEKVCEALDWKLHNAKGLLIFELDWTSIRTGDLLRSSIKGSLGHALATERPFTCHVDDCNSSYRRKDHLNRHVLCHKGKLFKCPVENCGRQFTIQGNMKRHLHEMHEEKKGTSEDEGPKEKKFVCQEIGCGKEFKYESRLRKHEESHVKLDSVEVFCADPSCMKPFSNVECLRAHMLSCHQHVTCEVCGSSQLRKNIKRHLRTHEEDHLSGKIKCNFEGCDHEFATKSNLQQHVKAAHLELKPFMCGISGCGKRFSFKHVRDKHEKSSCHSYVQGDFEEFDEQFLSRPTRGGRKRTNPSIESLMRKRITPPGLSEPAITGGADYLSWLLSSDNEDQ